MEGAPASTAEIIGALSGIELPTGLALVADESGKVAAVRRHLLDRVQFTGDWKLGGAL